ncbi:MAG: prephenate dehydrogenase/arogenate dehydrogenase family protein [Thaumarchaeota archaeon]|nr:prephenate dehydrogenase/arogenate dehydrogenase family protein [Nitrososphaerota archaeon]
MEKITIIGAGGHMGRWFSKYFVDAGYAVTGFDTEADVDSKGVEVASSLVGGILRADYVLLCTPTRRTPEIIRLIAKEMRRGAYLIDISSEKSKVISSLSRIPAKINPLCLHPMFGPGIRSLKKRNIISIPVRDAKTELAVTKKLFPGANFVTIDAAEHDKKVATILGLPHLINLCFASVTSKTSRSQLTEKMSGPTYKIQRTLAEGIMSESPDLIETIISNPDMRRHAEDLWKDIGRLLTAIQESKTEDVLAYVRACRERLEESSDLSASYKKMIRMASTID